MTEKPCSTCRHHNDRKCSAPQNIDFIDAVTGEITNHFIFCRTLRQPSTLKLCGTEGLWWAPVQKSDSFFVRMWGKMKRQYPSD